MDEAALELSAKNAVVESLTAAPDFPAAAGAFACRLAAKTLLDSGSGHDVRAVCKGVMAAALLLEKDLPMTALAMLNQMGSLADQTHQDPSQLMTWAMEGIAPVARIAGETTRDAVKDAISSAFMGAGEIFSRACETAGA